MGHPPQGLSVNHTSAQVPRCGIEIRIAVDHHPITGAGVEIWIPAVVRLVRVTVVAEKPRVVVVPVYLVFGEIEGIRHVFPIR